MIQIDKRKCMVVGYIQTTHGIEGEVIAVIEDEFMKIIESLEYIFIDIDGGLVPFFISADGLRYKNNESIIVKFDFIDSPVRAKDLVGNKLYVFKSEPAESENPQKYSGLTGMDVVDKNRGDLGKISRIDDYSGNVVVTVIHPQGEILIPLSDLIISKIDDENRKLYLTCPEGLIDIYL
jgi:16S rRNA processing protein RimM